LRLSFEKFLRNSSEIKFLRILFRKFLGLGHHVYGFLGEFKKFLGISLEFHPKKILRISPDYFSGNS